MVPWGGMVLGMALLWGLMFAGPALGQVALEATLGWGGIPVLDRVNPLWITVANLRGELWTGELRVTGEVGTPWRGEARHSFSAPLAIPPGGQARFLLPWEIVRGTRELFLTAVSREGEEVASLRLPVQAALTPLEGSVGPGPGIPLYPEDLTDPVLLHPFGRIAVAPGIRLGEEEWGVLEDWARCLGGELVAEGRRNPSLGWLPREALEGMLLQSRLPSPPLGPLVGALVFYLVGAGFSLGGLSRGRWAPLGLFFGLSAALALFCPVFYKPATGTISLNISLIWESGVRLCPEFLALASPEARPWQGEGWWWELLPTAPGSWQGRDLHWSWGPQGPQTTLHLRPGEVRVLWRLNAPLTFPGQQVYRFRLLPRRGWLLRLPDGKEAPAQNLLPPLLLPLWEYLQATLLPGEDFSLVLGQLRQGPHLIWRASLSFSRP